MSRHKALAVKPIEKKNNQCEAVMRKVLNGVLVYYSAFSCLRDSRIFYRYVKLQRRISNKLFEMLIRFESKRIIYQENNEKSHCANPHHQNPLAIYLTSVVE